MVKVIDVSDEDGHSTDSSVDIDQSQNVSMAASAAYIPGASLSDKLRLAASKGQVDKVHELISAGATFEPDREGRTALHYAALNGHSEVVQILADEGADINAQDALGYTALHRAAVQGHLEVIKVLLVEGCLVDKQDDVHGNSSLHEAAWNGYSKTLELLIRHKANVHCINKAGFTALHLAAQNGHNQSARVLLYAGCNPDMKNNYGDTAIHTAARYGHAGVTRILISARCNVSEQNKNGDTALHIAAALKRRKLTKLLVEAGINTSMKNKQNETAVDVARRKEHPEIIAIIATQLKNAKKSKKSKDKSKNKKDSGSKLALNTEEITEKKGLFFKKKNKGKIIENAKHKPVEANVNVMKHALKAPSEISSSEYNSQMAPEELLHGFRQHQATHRDSGQVNRGASTHGTSTKLPKTKVRGLLTEYVPKPGVQYYRDLAGNIRQGPIGYAPVCTCQPAFKKLEKQMEVDRNNLYDHIDTSHKTLANRIETLDKRTAQQIYSLDKLTKERFEAEKRNREDFVHSCIRKDRMEMQDDCEHRHSKMKQELKGYLDTRLTNFERYYGVLANRQEPCYWCHGNKHHHRPKYHDDDMLNQNNMVYDPEEPPMPGRLYKSKSEETLSVTSSHPSRRHWKLRTSAVDNVIDNKISAMNNRARRHERKGCSKSAGVSVRAASIEQLTHTRDSSLPARRPLDISEGDSGSNLHSEYKTYKDNTARQHHWKTTQEPVSIAATESSNLAQSRRYGLYKGSSQQVQVEVHQAERPRSASQSNSGSQSQRDANRYSAACYSSGRELCGNEDLLVRSRTSNSRTRSSSSSRAPDGTTFDRLSSQRQCSVPQSQSAYSLTASSQPVRNDLPHSASYDSSEPPQPPQRYAEHAQNNPLASTQGQGPTGLKPPTRTLHQTSTNTQRLLPQHVTPSSAATLTSESVCWKPILTSSPDTPVGMYNSSNNSDSLISSQTSSPLYPSPNCPKATRSESSSNPDSGYGSRLLGARQMFGPTLPSSNSSSFQSHEHDSSLSTNHSAVNGTLSPLVPATNRETLHKTGTSTSSHPNKRHEPQQPHQQQQQQQQAQCYQQPYYQQLKQQNSQQHRQYQQYTQENYEYNQQYHHQQQQQQQPKNSSVTRNVNCWYEMKTRDSQQQPNANTRMWPPSHVLPSSGSISDHRNYRSQPEQCEPVGVIGKATQV